MSEERLSVELLNLLGEADFLHLAEAYGGSRLYVPANELGTALSKAVGADAARKLSRRYPRAYLRIPLARAARASRFRQDGLSNAEIAKRLGMTESGVDRLFDRMDDPPTKGVDPRQLSLL